ncbi:putative MFS-type transporter YhjX [Orchesella cincta]|uniref:Putative MFS-type transporter YhjX n=1 Tax=Orchesella cincta TaxID=48709 RepID=A0A1D2MXA4_ORCCI|nr:putative MFS-type transporter YhjX [Orchesella cincta]
MATSQSSEVLAAQSKEAGLDKDGASKRVGCLSRVIQTHYNTTARLKSPEQIAREAYLIPRILPFNRWFSMPAAIIIQFCCGSLYSWSIFNKPIDALMSTQNMAPITFYIAVGHFGLSAAIMGPWLERNGPMLACFLGTSLFFLGNLLTALALYLQQIWLVFIGYGIISGFGLGLCYISPVSALQKWFPDKRGLASGFAVCGFGAGSIVIAKVQIPLIGAVGLPLTFVVLGSIYFVLMSACALVLRTPPPNFSVNGPPASNNQNGVTETKVEIGNGTGHLPVSSTPEFTLIEALTSNDFRFMYLMFLANALFGLVLISRLSNLITDIFEQSKDSAATVVAINGAFNLGGRLFFSIISDYIGRKNCYVIMLTSQLIILATFSVITTTRTYWAFLMTMWILTACYGAGFGVIPAFLTDKFGSSNIGACHGVILTAWSFAGVVGGLIFSAVFNKTSDGLLPSDPYPYIVNVWWIFGVVVLGWIALMFVKPTKRDSWLIEKPRMCFTTILSAVGLSKRSQRFSLRT